TIQSFIEGGNYKKYNWTRIRNTAEAKATFLDERLEVIGDFSYQFTPYLYNSQRSPINYSPSPGEFVVNEPHNDWRSEERHRTDYLSTNIYTNYTQRFNNHKLRTLLGFNYENSKRNDVYWKRYELINPALPDPSLITV